VNFPPSTPPASGDHAAGRLGRLLCHWRELPVGLLPVISAGLHSSLLATGLLVTVYALVVVAFSVPLTRLTCQVPRLP
jgi:hypothetical protein